MSGFMGRPYITSLNTIHSAEDVAAQQSAKVNVDEDLSKYRIEEFFDIDMGEHVDYGRPVTFDAGLMDRSGRGNALATAAAPTSVDFLDSTFQFPELPIGFQDLLNDQSVTLPATLSNGDTSTVVANPVPLTYPSESTASDTSATSGTPTTLEERSRHLAEEDKRRRNTAASARFRVKKKQREQELEKRVKEQVDKNQGLEVVIQQLRMENKWLKELVTEKNAGRSKDREEPRGDRRCVEEKAEGTLSISHRPT